MGCGKKAVKTQLLRFVRQENEKLLFDLHQRAYGRGGYLCPQVGCFNSATKKKRISIRFRRHVKEDPSSLIKTVLDRIENETIKWNRSRDRVLESRNQGMEDQPSRVSEPVLTAIKFHSEFFSGGSTGWPK